MTDRGRGNGDNGACRNSFNSVGKRKLSDNFNLLGKYPFDTAEKYAASLSYGYLRAISTGTELSGVLGKMMPLISPYRG